MMAPFLGFEGGHSRVGPLDLPVTNGFSSGRDNIHSGRAPGGTTSCPTPWWIKVYGLETISCLANAIAWIGRNQSGVGKRGWPFGTNQLILIT